MHVLYGILSTAVFVHLVAMALDTGQPSVWVLILCAVVIIFAGDGKRQYFLFYTTTEKPRYIHARRGKRYCERFS